MLQFHEVSKSKMNKEHRNKVRKNGTVYKLAVRHATDHESQGSPFAVLRIQKDKMCMRGKAW